MRSFIALTGAFRVNATAPVRHALELAATLGVAGRLTTDLQITALALEYRATLHSADTDFARMPGLRWSNPIARR